MELGALLLDEPCLAPESDLHARRFVMLIYELKLPYRYLLLAYAAGRSSNWRLALPAVHVRIESGTPTAVHQPAKKTEDQHHRSLRLWRHREARYMIPAPPGASPAR